MSKFKDAAGNEWHIEIDFDSIRRVRKDTGFAFGTCLNDEMKTWFEMLEDFELMPAVLASLLFDQLKQKGVAQTTFLANIKGDAIDDAREALWDALSFFCPKRQRKMLTQLKTAMERMQTVADAEMMTAMETFIETHSESNAGSESPSVAIHSES